ncbi:MAG: D-TA family PLP-dependent enzyme [Flavobacteriaceae bacterium]|nr:D-TA family PLP-dependent enzyme [Flavobacteriaceae bacterium]
MIDMAGGTTNLRPHIKTHKIAEIINLQLDQGIYKFKCATIAEAELLGQCGAKDVLLAMQPVAIDIDRFFMLIKTFSNTLFSTLVDNHKTLKTFAEIAQSNQIQVSLWMDINNGMNRTGIVPDKKAFELYQTMHNDINIVAKGFHVYDGHIRNSNIKDRIKVCNKDFEPVLKLKNDLEKSGIKVKTIIAGGSITFPIHAKTKSIETSPGTTLLWDEGYSKSYKDLNFLPAAVLLTRVTSKPKTNLICFDLGHKSVAAEKPLPRVKFLDINNFSQISQSEEHLVVETIDDDTFNIGNEAYAIPIHICPTVARYNSVLTVIDGNITASWKVVARDYKITI